MPSVTATAACSGFRPVAKALGVSVGMVHARHRDLSARGQPAQDGVEAGRLRLIDRLGPVHRQHDLVGEPVAEEIHGHGQDEGDHHALPATDGAPDQDEHRGEYREKDCGLEHVGHESLLVAL